MSTRNAATGRPPLTDGTASQERPGGNLPLRAPDALPIALRAWTETATEDEQPGRRPATTGVTSAKTATCWS